jgi:hypothetical protein
MTLPQYVFCSIDNNSNVVRTQAAAGVVVRKVGTVLLMYWRSSSSGSPAALAFFS